MLMLMLMLVLISYVHLLWKFFFKWIYSNKQLSRVIDRMQIKHERLCQSGSSQPKYIK